MSQSHLTFNIIFPEPRGPFRQDTGPLTVAALPTVSWPGPGPDQLALGAGDAPAPDLPPAPPHIRPGLLLHRAGQAV